MRITLDRTEQCCGVCLPALTIQEFGIMPHQAGDTLPTAGVDPLRLGPAASSSASASADWPELDVSLLEDGRPVLQSFPLMSGSSLWSAGTAGSGRKASTPAVGVNSAPATTSPWTERSERSETS